jgi:hypothetical protein
MLANPNISCGFTHRLAFLIVSLLTGFGLAIWGGIRLDYERPLFSAVLIIAVIIIPSSGWFLYGATLFQSTCGWWL